MVPLACYVAFITSFSTIRAVILRETIFNRTYGTPKTLPVYIFLFVSNSIWSYILWSPATVVVVVAGGGGVGVGIVVRYY